VHISDTLDDRIPCQDFALDSPIVSFAFFPADCIFVAQNKLILIFKSSTNKHHTLPVYSYQQNPPFRHVIKSNS
jgi:hypothetical protein